MSYYWKNEETEYIESVLFIYTILWERMMQVVSLSYRVHYKSKAQTCSYIIYNNLYCYTCRQERGREAPSNVM